MDALSADDDLYLYLVAQDLLGRYAHGVDHGDLDVTLGVFWPDANDHHGNMWNGNAQDYMRDMYSRQEPRHELLEHGPGFQHHMTTILVKRTGPDDARLQSAFVAYVPHVVDGQARVGVIVGRFLDQIQRRDGVWKILARDVINDFTGGEFGATPFPSGSWQEGGFVAGGYGPTDPGMAFLATPPPSDRDPAGP